MYICNVSQQLTFQMFYEYSKWSYIWWQIILFKTHGPIFTNVIVWTPLREQYKRIFTPEIFKNLRLNNVETPNISNSVFFFRTQCRQFIRWLLINVSFKVVAFRNSILPHSGKNSTRKRFHEFHTTVVVFSASK